MHFLEIFGQKKCLFCQKQCFLDKKCTITWYIFHILLSWYCKFAVTRKNNAFVAKFVNTRLTIIFMAIFAPDESLLSSATLSLASSLFSLVFSFYLQAFSSSPVHTLWSLFLLAPPPPLASSEPHHKMNHFVIIETIHHDDEHEDAVIEHLIITSIACLGPNPDPGPHVVVVETCVKTSCSQSSS